MLYIPRMLLYKPSRCTEVDMEHIFGAEYVSLHVRVSNEAATHLYQTTLGFRYTFLLFPNMHRAGVQVRSLHVSRVAFVGNEARGLVPVVHVVDGLIQ